MKRKIRFDHAIVVLLLSFVVVNGVYSVYTFRTPSPSPANSTTIGTSWTIPRITGGGGVGGYYFIPDNPDRMTYHGEIGTRFASRLDAFTVSWLNSKASGDNPRILRIFIDSTGGDFGYSVLAGNDLKVLENEGFKVEILVTGECASGCFLMSTYASSVYLYPNSTYGIGHHASEYSAFFWSSVMQTIANNKHWSVNYIESIAPNIFTAKQAYAAHLVDGIIEIEQNYNRP